MRACSFFVLFLYTSSLCFSFLVCSLFLCISQKFSLIPCLFLQYIYFADFHTSDAKALQFFLSFLAHFYFSFIIIQGIEKVPQPRNIFPLVVCANLKFYTFTWFHKNLFWGKSNFQAQPPCRTEGPWVRFFKFEPPSCDTVLKGY